MRYRYREEHEMKDSGVEWLDKIPKDWQRNKLKRELEFSVGATPSTSNKDFFEGENIWVTISDLKGKYCGESKTKITQGAIKSTNMKKVPCNSLLYSFKLSVGQVAFTTKELYTNEAIASFYPSEKYNLNFWYYALKTYLIENANENIYGAKLLNQDLINNANVFVPNKLEQEKIANFLDEKTSQFDLIISKKEELIQRLEEAKKSLISEIVTGKVKVVKSDDGYELVKRSSEDMKDSGVEWLGEIPRDWSLEKGKWLFYNSNEKGDESKILLSATQDRGVIPKDQLDSVVQNKEDTDFTNFKLVKKYDFIISLRSFQGGFEMSQYDEGIITPAYSVLRSKIELNPYYYKYLLKERGFIGILNSLTVGIRDGKNIKYDDFAKVLLPKPPLKEQQAISDYINISISNISSTIDKTNKQIKKLKEAKQSLISEAVTGKIEILD